MDRGRSHERVVRAAVLGGVPVLVVLTLLGEHLGRPAAGGRLALDLAVGVLSCALLPLLLRRPVPAGLALAVLAAGSTVATPPATVGALVAAQRRRFPAAVAVAGVGVAAHLVQGLWRPLGGLTYGWWLVLTVAGYAALLGWGTLTQARQALLESLRERAERAEAEQARRVAEARALERTRIAREMHDVLAHRLSLVATYAGALEYRPDSSPEQLSRAAGVVRAGVQQALGELREVIGVLREEAPAGGAGDSNRPQPGLADLLRLVGESQEAGQRVRFDSRVDGAATVPALAGRTAFRVVQEALTNARRHAAGQPVTVAVTGEPGTALVIDVANPLPPGRPQPPAGGGGTGLVGLAERVQLAGGSLEHRVSSAGGFQLHARLPWPA